MSFIELFNFIIYQRLNKRTKILPLATSQLAHLCYQFNIFALPISKPRLKSIMFFIKIALKLSYFCKKMQNFRALGAPPPDSHWPPAAGVQAPRTPKQPPPIANFWLCACCQGSKVCPLFRPVYGN